MSARRPRVLVLCTGNSARSQMAEVILRHVSGGGVDVASAGSAPQAAIHPMARIAARRLLHVEMDGQEPKRLDRFIGETFDYVITVCDRAAESCPIFPGHPQQIHWSLPDPAAVEGSDETRQQAFDDVASDLLRRIEAWMPSIRTQDSPP